MSRQYDNTLRRERAAQTRDNIVTAAADLLRESSIRDWRTVTVRAVAGRAGINERTVFRHFPNERALRDAVMHHLEKEVGIDLADLRLDGVADAAARIMRQVSTHPIAPHPDLDPTLADAKRRQHEALLAAVADQAPMWSARDRTAAAAMLDVMWAVATYERLVSDWDLPRDEAVRAVTWVIRLMETAIAEGRRPARR